MNDEKDLCEEPRKAQGNSGTAELETASLNPPKPKREYKDRLFKAIFGRDTEESKRWRLDLYNALNNTNYTDPDALTLTTIENVIYITMKNDISFLIGSQMNLYE